MSNKELIERLRDTPNWQRESYGQWKSATCVYDRAPFEAADALEAAERKLTVNSAQRDLDEAEWRKREGELERKLEIAREALEQGRTYLVRMALINAGMLIASGEFTTLVNDSLDEFIGDHLHEVSDSESPIAEFDWTRIAIRKMAEALAQLGDTNAGS